MKGWYSYASAFPANSANIAIIKDMRFMVIVFYSVHVAKLRAFS